MLIDLYYKLNSLLSQLCISIDDESLKEVYHSRVLCVQNDQHLSKDKHIEIKNVVARKKLARKLELWDVFRILW